MATATLRAAPVEAHGIVIRDGDATERRPRIVTYFWANEEETDPAEREESR